LNHSIHQHNI